MWGTTALVTDCLYTVVPGSNYCVLFLQVFVSSIPQVSFKLGPKALVYLLHQFYYCNFSLTDFARSLQVINCKKCFNEVFQAGDSDYKSIINWSGFVYCGIMYCNMTVMSTVTVIFTHCNKGVV